VKRALIGEASVSWNQWNVLLLDQQKSAWSAKGEYRETLWIITLASKDDSHYVFNTLILEEPYLFLVLSEVTEADVSQSTVDLFGGFLRTLW
jgi:hypothetical protein